MPSSTPSGAASSGAATSPSAVGSDASLPGSRRGPAAAVVALACLGQLLVVVDVSIVNVALPSMRDALGMDDAALSWVVNAYTVAFAGAVLLGGRAADLIGSRAAFVTGMVLFSGASLLAGLATTTEVLVAGRSLQGLGAALLAPATLTLLTTNTAEGRARVRAIALWSTMSAAGGALGAVVGGILVQTLSWRWVLLVNVPLGAIAAVAALRVVPAGRSPKPADPAGSTASVRSSALAPVSAVLVSVGLAGVVYGIVETTGRGWTSTAVVVPVTVGLLSLAAFAVVDGHLSARPLLPLGLLRIRSVATANLVVLASGGAFVAVWYFVTLYQQEVLGRGPIAAGVGFLPHTLSIMVAARVSGRLADRIDPRLLMAGGLLTSAVGFVVQAQAPADGLYLTNVLVPGILICAGAGLYLPQVTQIATSGLPREAAGMASGVVNASRWISGALGLAVLVTVSSSRSESARENGASAAEALTAGFDRAFVGSALMLLVAVAFVAFVPRPRKILASVSKQSGPDRRTGESGTPEAPTESSAVS